MVLIFNGDLVTLAIVVSKHGLGGKVDEVTHKSDVTGDGLVYLDVHDVLHGLLDIKNFWVLHEPTILDLCISKNVLHVKKKHL